jgi:hypothetical protein
VPQGAVFTRATVEAHEPFGTQAVATCPEQPQDGEVGGAQHGRGG